jgi:DNA helicase-4
VDFYRSDIRETLKQLLLDAGVPLQERTDTELYSMVLPEGSKQEKAFIRLIATFVTLLKSSCRSLKDVLKQTDEANDRRSEFVVKNIFRPVYERYAEALRSGGQIDFTDAILQATELCRATHPVSYEYIIVDEFQDISVDRYNFLKALREGNPREAIWLFSIISQLFSAQPKSIKSKRPIVSVSRWLVYRLDSSNVIRRK